MAYFKQTTPKMVYVFLIFSLIFAFSVTAQTQNVLFLGVFNQKGEQVEPLLEQALRHEFLATSNFALVGSEATQKYLIELERLGVTPLERVIPPKAKAADSAIVVWTVVKESSMRIGRHILFWGKINASLTLEIFISDISSGNILYRGELSASAAKVKDFLFVLSAQKNVHISAIDRSELKAELQSKIVESAKDIFSIVFDSLSDSDDDTDENYSADTANVSDDAEHRVPSIADSFSEPAFFDLTEGNEGNGAEQSESETQTQVFDPQQTELPAGEQGEDAQ